MIKSSVVDQSARPKTLATGSRPLGNYLQIVLYRKWMILAIFFVITVITVLVVQTLPNVYTAQTLILVDPQKVPETYVKSTVTGSIRDRLGTLSQQILSATRLQKIIDNLHLYQDEKKKLSREEIITMMRKDIKTTVVSDFGASQDLQAFRISYNGSEPRLVAQVTNELASLFIDENLRAREQQSSGTTEFLQNQLQETRKRLEEQEAKLKDYRLKHIGEMPEQENADLQILGSLHGQLQREGEDLNRAQQTKLTLQSMMTQSLPVVDLDSNDDVGVAPTGKSPAGNNANVPVPKRSSLEEDRAKLAEMQKHYSDKWPDVVALKKRIQEEETREAKDALAGTGVESQKVNIPVPAPPPSLAVPKPATTAAAPPPRHFNPVIQGQLEALDVEIGKHRQEVERLSKMIAGYQARVEQIPVRQQEVMDLSRDYDMTRQHYGQLETQALSAETATQLEYRQKGEKFVVLDPAVAPEKPSKPDRPLLNLAGAMLGLILGVAVALLPEFIGMTIIGPQDIESTSNLTILETIPVIMTHSDRIARKRRVLIGMASAALSTVAAVILFLRLRSQI